MLSQDQKSFFHENGYLVVENAVSEALLQRLQDEFSGWVEESRQHDAPFGTMLDGRPRFDMEAGHNKEQPAFRRVSSPAESSDS